MQWVLSLIQHQIVADISLLGKQGLSADIRLIEPTPFHQQTGIFDIYTDTVMLVTIRPKG